MPQRLLVCLLGCAFVATGVLRAADPPAAKPAESAADVSTRLLLEALQKAELHDVTLAVAARVAADAEAGAEIKREAAFRRAGALIGVSRTEADAKKRTGLLDQAQTALDEFLQKGAPSDRQAIEAYTQRATLLVERGRRKAEEAKKPGADAKALLAEAVTFFDGAAKSLEGTAKPGEPITKVANAEDAILKLLRDVDAKIEGIKNAAKPPEKDDKGKDDKGKDDKGKDDKPKPVRLSPQQQRELEALEEEQEDLREKLILTRLMAANVLFEKAKALPDKSKERTDALTTAAAAFKELADKYPTKGGGLYARLFEGRAYAMLGKNELAINTLISLTLLDQQVPLAYSLRSKSLATMLECLLAEKKYEKFDDSARKFALEDVSKLRGATLDADWLELKYRAAVLLDTRATALPENDAKVKSERMRLQADAKKLATEVAKANREFAKEARELAAKLGKVVAEGEKTFAAVMDEARVAISTMQDQNAQAKAATAANDAAKADTARQAAATARDEAQKGLLAALALAGVADPMVGQIDEATLKDATIDDVNGARYLLTFMLYDGGRYEDAARLGGSLAEFYPNAKGSRQAAKAALSAWQLLAQRAEGQAREAARGQAVELAGKMMRIWPDADESADAAIVAIGSAVTARDPKAMLTVLGQVPATSPKRPEVLLRTGTALYREVQEARRLDESARPDQATIDGWKGAATKALDEGLAAIEAQKTLPAGQLGPLAVAAAVTRVQIAMEDGDNARAIATLEQPVYGPWTVVASGQAQGGSIAEAALTLALRLFIQAEQFDKAQQAMDGLEKVAGQGDDGAAKLSSMYYAMGRDLQAQLEALGSGADAGSPEVRERATRIRAGFEKFLDRVGSQTSKTSAQMWVATTYQSLGTGTAGLTPAEKSKYLGKAVESFEKLIGKKDDPEVAKFESAIRMRMAAIYQDLGKWKEAREQLDTVLATPKGRNSLDAQILAAELLQTAGKTAAAEGRADEANDLLREAAGGRKGGAAEVWGWGNIANRLARQGFSGPGDQAQRLREIFFNARLQVVECLLIRAKLPGKEADKPKRLETAKAAIALTRQLYPDLGGEASAKRFERVLKEVQKELGDASAPGFAALDAPPAAAPAGAEGGTP